VCGTFLPGGKKKQKIKKHQVAESDSDDEDEEDEEESPVKMKKQPSSSHRTKNPRAKKGNNVNKKTVVSKMKN